MMGRLESRTPRDNSKGHRNQEMRQLGRGQSAVAHSSHLVSICVATSAQSLT